jgi:hypothetical protein
MPLPEGNLLPEADDESMVETPNTAETDTASESKVDQGSESGVDASAVSQAAEPASDSNMSQITESGSDSNAESYPADAEKVAGKRESITVLLMRVDAEGCTIQGSHDYVSNMFADFGLINVNPGYEEVRVTLPKEDAESDSASKADEIQAEDSKAADSTVESGAETDSQPAVDENGGSVSESGAEADSQPAVGEESNSASEPGAEAGSQPAAGEESNSASEPGAETDSQPAIGEKEGSSAKADARAKDRPANEIEFENILSRNPDYIFVIYEGKEKTAEKTYKEICESREFWGNMTAVRNRHVYTLPQSTFAYPPNDQWDLAYEYLFQMMFVM